MQFQRVDSRNFEHRRLFDRFSSSHGFNLSRCFSTNKVESPPVANSSFLTYVAPGMLNVTSRFVTQFEKKPKLAPDKPPSLPVAAFLSTSFVVGGFVGSKSQVGSLRSREFSLWDVILDKFIELRESSSQQRQSPVVDMTATENQPPNEPEGAPPQRAQMETETVTKEPPSRTTSISSTSCSSDSSLPGRCHRVCSRTLSECSIESEDSFIVFDAAEDESDDGDESETVYADEYSLDNDSSSDDNFDELDNCLLLPIDCNVIAADPLPSRLEEANEKWNCHYSRLNGVKRRRTNKKVSFASDTDLVTVKPMVTWSFAYRAARKGPWEMMARDSERFKLRITQLSDIISPVLKREHRNKVYSSRFKRSPSPQLTSM